VARLYDQLGVDTDGNSPLDRSIGLEKRAQASGDSESGPTAMFRPTSSQICHLSGHVRVRERGGA
jgi:hypothetical protein